MTTPAEILDFDERHDKNKDVVVVADATPVPDAARDDNHTQQQVQDELEHLKREVERLKQSQQSQSRTNRYPPHGTAAPATFPSATPSSANSPTNERPRYRRGLYSSLGAVGCVALAIVVIVVSSGGESSEGGEKNPYDEDKPSYPTTPSSPMTMTSELNALLLVDATGFAPDTKLKVTVTAGTLPGSANIINQEDEPMNSYFDFNQDIQETITIAEDENQSPVFLAVPPEVMNVDIADNAGVFSMEAINCTSGNCSTGPLARTMAIDLRGVNRVHVGLQTKHRSTVKEMRYQESNWQLYTVLPLTYTVSVQYDSSSSVTKWVEDVDCTDLINSTTAMPSCTVQDVVARLTMNLTGLQQGITVYIYKGYEGSQIRRSTYQGNAVRTFPILALSDYMVRIVEGNEAVKDYPSVDCESSLNCRLENVTATMTLATQDLGPRTELYIRIYDQAALKFWEIRSFRSGVAALGRTLSLKVLRLEQKYYIALIERSAEMHIELDCFTTGTCDAGTVARIMTIDLRGLSDDVTVELWRMGTDSNAFRTLDRTGGQLVNTGVFAIDDYAIALKEGNHWTWFDAIDCSLNEGALCTPGPVTSVLTIQDLPVQERASSRFWLQYPGIDVGSPPITGRRMDTADGATTYITTVVCRNDYIILFDATPNSVSVSNVVCPCGGNCTMSYNDAL